MPPESGAQAARVEGEPARGRFYTGISTLRPYTSVCMCVCVCISRSISLLTVFNTFDAFIFVMNTLSPLSRLSHNSQRCPKN